MKYLTRALLIFTMLVIPLALTCEENEDQPNEMKQKILELINAYRQENDLGTLEMNNLLSQSALSHVDYMIEQGEISHDNFNERADYLIKEIGGRSIAENVANGYPTAERAVKGWIDSPNHLKNIEGDYNLTGIAVKQSPDGTHYYCQIFMKK